MEDHVFSGRWMTAAHLAPLRPIPVFHRQLDGVRVEKSAFENQHVLFRRRFSLEQTENAVLYITADDYFKLYINGRYVTQGPAPAYPSRWGYLTADVSAWLHPGENLIAVHTYYQGLINRVWVSGDNRHGLLLDLVQQGRTLLCSDESFRCAVHTGYTAIGKAGYDTQFLEEYDAASPYVRFEQPDYRDDFWDHAVPKQYADWVTVPQETPPLVTEELRPVRQEILSDGVFADFGGVRVGYPRFAVRGRRGETVELLCGQELNDDGSVRYELRSNCVYRERMRLSGDWDVYDAFDYKSFRYLRLILPPGAQVRDVTLLARHYPFVLKAAPSFRDPALREVWRLCVNTARWGAQEVIQDCMEREKGFYLGDGCYSSLTHAVLCDDWRLVRKLIDDALASSFITPGLVTCMDCSFMQEIAEYPLMLFPTALAYGMMTGDWDFLRQRVGTMRGVLEDYRARYENADGLLQDLDKWCVVEWPKNFQDDYDADVREGQICHPAHCEINAYYLMAIRVFNLLSAKLGLPAYRDEAPLYDAFVRAFYDPQRHLFRDRADSAHCSFPANGIVFGFGLWPDEACREQLLAMVRQRTVAALSFFVTFPVLFRLKRLGLQEELERQMALPGTWKRMLREGADVTFEGWGRDTKWNTSLFHMTMSYGALFLTDALWKKIEEEL